DRRAVGAKQLRRGLGHLVKERIEIGDGHQVSRDLEDDVEALTGAAPVRLLTSLAHGTTVALTTLAVAVLAHWSESFSSIGATVSATCSRSIWSRRSNVPSRLFSAWMTPTGPASPHTGTHSMFSVRNPVRRSTFRSNRASAY